MHKSNKKILFLLKKRHQIWNEDDQYASELSSGLLNSVRFVAHMINRALGPCRADMSQVHDANAIDREIHYQRPHMVVIEALWVTPDKLRELSTKYPQIIWVVRLHSEVPFLANEGMAMQWLTQYRQVPRVRIGANSSRLRAELADLLDTDILHLPNFYEHEEL